MIATTPGFVPADLDAADWSRLEPLYTALQNREVASRESLETWLLDRSELEAAASEGEATLYIRMTRNTEDRAAADAYTRYLEEVAPKLKTARFALDKRQVELQERFVLDADRYGVLDRDTRTDVELFREENVPLQTHLAKLSQQYEQISGAMTVRFRGDERTMPQMARFMEETDRATREEAWRAVAERRLRDADRLEDLFDEMLEHRQRVAENAGFSNYLEYAFRAKHRFDYTPEMCREFHASVESEVVPVMRRLDAARREALGIDPLRPWDLTVDIAGREPLRPFEAVDELIDDTQRMFEQMGGGLGDLFKTLREGDSLDLDSRRGKAPGGYQYMRDFSRTPFIFMNAAGLHGDVRTMIHEAGHAFHSLLCRGEPLVQYRHAPIEFSEVASMAMELLSMGHWRAFYESESEAARARREQLEGVVNILPWIATVDAFQHWLYTNPGHTRDQRREHWVSLMRCFGHDASWEGLEDVRAALWHRQLHIFTIPLYYIEYGIAQLGALQLWVKARRDGLNDALDAYKAGLSVGGSRPLPELFELAGIRFDFSRDTLRALMAEVEGELEAMDR